LTPHAINIFDSNKEEISTISPSGDVARVSIKKREVSSIDGIPCFVSEVGEVVGLPEEKQDTKYLVSLMVFNATSRKDVVSPGELIRNEKGQPIGCLGLNVKTSV